MTHKRDDVSVLKVFEENDVINVKNFIQLLKVYLIDRILVSKII